MAIAADTPIPTPMGFVLASELKPGGYIFDAKGQVQKIGSVQAYMPSECYRVEFEDGLALVGDRHMAFDLQDKKWRDRHLLWLQGQDSKYAKKKYRRPLRRMTAVDLSKASLTNSRGRSNFALQTCLPVRYPQRNLPVPPYIVGLWLGSVTPTGKHFIGAKDFNKMQKMVRRFGFNLTRTHTKNSEFFFRPSVRESFTFAHAEIPDILPFSYLEADVDSRMLLLEGLTDARDVRPLRSYKNKFVISDTWRSIRRKQFLLEGLGYVTTLEKKSDRSTYMLKFFKKDEILEKNRRYVTKIEKILPRQCIHVAAESNFLAGEGFLAVC